MRIKDFNFLDLQVIYDAIKEWKPDEALVIRQYLRRKNCWVVGTPDTGILLFVEAPTPKVGYMHIYVKPSHRGKKVIQFHDIAKRWFKENTHLEKVINYVDEDRRDIKILMRKVGAKFVRERKDGISVFRSFVD